jgi:hypothetical protein
LGCFDYGFDRFGTTAVPFDAWEFVLLCPATITIHNDGDVFRGVYGGHVSV